MRPGTRFSPLALHVKTLRPLPMRNQQPAPKIERIQLGSLINASCSRFPSNSSVLSPNVGNNPVDDSKDANGPHQHAHVLASSLIHAPNSTLSHAPAWCVDGRASPP